MHSNTPFPKSLRCARHAAATAWALGALSAAFLAGCAGAPNQEADDSLVTGTGTSPPIHPVATDSNGKPLPQPSASASSDNQEPSTDGGVPDPVKPIVSEVIPPVDPKQTPSWVEQNSVSLRSALPLPPLGTILNAEVLATQLAGYDPGSLLRCAVTNDGAYQTAIDAIGGVRWGYGVTLLEDQSKPRIYAGFPDWSRLLVPGAAPTDANAGGAVEIVKADIVAVTDAAALFYTPGHGLMVVALNDGEATFDCATPLPGNVDQFYFYDGHLIAMTKSPNQADAHLLHFKIDGTSIEFVEDVNLGKVNILDSRRFNDKLVFYTDLRLDPAVAASSDAAPPNGNGAAIAPSPQRPIYQAEHRALHVYTIGDTLENELYDTLIDETLSVDQLVSERVTPETLPGTEVSESRRFGYDMWASDHYFVVTEQITKTLFSDWVVQQYNACTASHVVEYPYQYCWTEYETRPNPDYTEPDNSGGDRACKGTTLSDCLVAVAKVANKTIQVPVGRKCEEQIRRDWVCDAYELQTVEYPTFSYEETTQLYIYEYNDAGFVRLDSQVHEITNENLASADPSVAIDALTTSTETYDLAVPGAIQTLYFQNGFLYVISQGVLQVYAMGGSSIVRTATLPVVNETLQASLFSKDKLFLSDFGWSSSDHSTLKVVNLSNPGFPTVDGATHQLPGGHRSILASDFGIFTIGSVQTFMDQQINAIKLGLFSDPFAEEKAYLILGTDLANAWLGTEESQLFNGASQRLMLPYSGTIEGPLQEYRIGASHLTADEIVSEGAVVVPEMVERVRMLPGDTEAYLSFAPNSIERITPNQAEWKTDPVLEYLQPQQVYRLNDENDYVEVQRLGKRCRLYFANASDINQRANGTYSAEFTCGTWGQAYANRLIFDQLGVEFSVDDHSVRVLSDEEVQDTYALIAARQYCLLSLEIVDDVSVDFANIPDDVTPTCFTPEEYQAAQQELLNTPAPTP